MIELGYDRFASSEPESGPASNLVTSPRNRFIPLAKPERDGRASTEEEVNPGQVLIRRPRAGS